MKRKPRTRFCFLLAFALFGVWGGTAHYARAGGVDSTAYRYMNEWYQFNQNYIKLLVSEDGLYRVSLADLSSAGVQNLATLNPDRLQIFYRGQEVPAYVTKNGGSLNYFEFLGRKNDGGIDSLMYRRPYTPFAFDPEEQPNRFSSFFTDTSAYFITWDDMSTQRYTGISPNNFSAHTALPFYRYKVVTEYQTNYFAGGGGKAEVAHILNPDYITGEGFIGKEFETGDLIDVVAVYVPTPGFANSGNPTQVKARVVTITNSNQHITAIDIMSSDRYLDTTYGINIKTHQFDLNIPLPNSTLFRFHAYGLGSKKDKQRVAWQSLEYDRLFDLDQASSTVIRKFSHSDTTYLRFYNADYSSTAFLFDPVNKVRIEARVSNDTLQFLVPGSAAERTLYMYTDSEIRKPTIKPRTELSNLSNVGAGAEFVIITHPRFANSAQQYAHYRDTSTVNPVSSTKVVYINQIMDEFAYGSFTSWGIKNFCKYALDNWNTKPKYILLWGKAHAVHRLSAAIDYVPSFGFPANDYEFVSDFDRVAVDFEPQAAIGRVSIYLDSEGLAYLNKVRDYEHQEYDGWMKRAVMLGGGKTGAEQARIRTALVNNYTGNLEGNPVGGEVYYFQKQGNGIETNAEKTSTDIISDGVGLIHFFGHSGTNIFDVDIQEATRYTNYHRYPFMVAFGCYGGNFLESTKSFGERFLLEPERGSIGYLANSTAGFLQQLYDYGSVFYETGTGTHYNQAIGDVIRETIKKYANSFNGYSNILVANHCKQVNLQGDPRIVVRFPEKPDLSVEKSDIFFTPKNLSAQTPNYVLNVIAHNEGRVFQDSFKLRIKHRAPTGEEIIYDQVQYGPIILSDTLQFSIENTLGNKLAGLNQFEIFLDAQDSLDEYSESNNKVIFSPLIQGNIPAILFPYEYAIVDKDKIALSASTINMSADRELNYIFEIDTVHTFDSPFKTVSGLVTGTSPYCR
ncbi:MAG TPA: hypothetical protein ENJ82_07360, partial [Bacteroidetes bacterium]|nr:hypothetical protein [Bacteroidota bacterium]